MKSMVPVPAAFALAVHLFAVSALFSPSAAADLVVSVQGVASSTGEVGCALYASAAGFPTDPARSVSSWVKADPAGVQCRFAGLAPGTYAVAVSHDLNGNRRTDTNFLGIPTEAWGVSNNVRPTMRAPTFDEAAIALGAAPTTTITVKVQR